MQMYVCSDFAHFEQLLDNIADKRFRLLQSTLPLRGIIEQESPADAGIPARRKNGEKNSSISKL